MENTTTLTTTIKKNIATTIVWARYAAIISLINLGLSFLQLLVGFIKGNPFMFLTVFFFLVSTVITFVLSVNLLKYSNHAESGINRGDSTQLYQALFHLRIYFIVIGILFLIAIGLLLLFFLVAIISVIIS